MKRLLGVALASLTLLLPAFALAASDHDAHAGHLAQSNKTSESPMSEGIVRKVDKAAAKVTVTHGPLANLGMPAMTMVFRVKDAAWLDRMQTGSNIRFQADSINGALTIVRFELAP
ncbi:copper-binding protein [Propionivibrio sp.]|uniref:copper-binding protein n=1 Tax=Propionivibrio sp. TaxID=2212460 RepID=UPI003BF19E45